jgi:putative SOS response-associated peptidase YedK
MCGKFTQKVNWTDAVTLRQFNDAPPEAPADTITPFRFANVICLDVAGRRQSVRMRWGLVSATAPDQAVGTKFIHARAETIEQKPTFREAFLRRRGLVVVDTFNEGKEITPNKTEQYVITMCGRRATAIAVIWERWLGPSPVPLDTFAMVTTPPNALIATITDRMPAVIADEHWAQWLGEEPATIDELKAILQPSGMAMDMEKAGRPAPPPKPSAQSSLF